MQIIFMLWIEIGNGLTYVYVQLHNIALVLTGRSQSHCTVDTFVCNKISCCVSLWRILIV